MNILFILLAVLLLGIIVTVHEWGHFFSARIVGIPVKEFSIGFGPTLFSWKSKKHNTIFKLSAIPMGGYCMYYGETASDPEALKAGEETLEATDSRLYMNHSPWKRIFTILAGPVMNFVLAVVVAIVMVANFGGKIESFRITEFTENSPAHTAGLQVGDEILSVEGISVLDGTQNGLRNAINAKATPGTALQFEVLRNGERLQIAMTPDYIESEQRYAIGVGIMPVLGKLEAKNVIPEALHYTKQASTAMIDALGKLFTTGEGFDQTSGPIGVVKVVSEQTKTGGFAMYLNLAVIISINLGLVNLLPIPGLDGARFIFTFIEAIRKKPINQKIEGYIHMTGMLFLFGLLAFLTLRDVLNIFR
ncbi:MAG: RIP metalloprotease RseP [Eubacteriales bacterium]|nr:RIP metalloprotease RseP [Eubacteriales bacterium]